MSSFDTPRYNNSQFTTAQIRSILPTLIKKNLGLIEARNLSELGDISSDCENEVLIVDEDKGLVYVEFEQYDPGTDSYEGAGDAFDAWTYNYKLVIEVPTLKAEIATL